MVTNCLFKQILRSHAPTISGLLLFPLLPLGALERLCRIMINDFGDGREWYLDDFAVGYFHLQTRCRQRLCCFHAANDTAHAAAVRRHDLYVVLTVERLERCEGFGDFHFCLPRFL